MAPTPASAAPQDPPTGSLLRRLRPWPHSFALRTALGSAAAVILVCGVGFGWGYLRAEAALREQIDRTVAAEAEGFIAEYEALGPSGLVQAVAAQSRRRSGTYTQVQTMDGQVLAGDLPGAPLRLVGLATLTVGPQTLRAAGAILPGGLNLIVAADLAASDRTAAAMASTLPVAGALAAVAALALGFAGARRLESRLRKVNAAAREVMAGKFSERLPLAGEDDEFDRLAGTINTMLGRIEELVSGLRQVTDDIAHDLRSPLSRLRQKLEGALSRARDPSQDAEALQQAIAELDAVLGTFSALLRISRAEAGLRTPPQQLSLSALVSDVAEIYQAVAEEDGKSLQISVTPGLHILGEPQLLRQMVANLIENALTHGGPTVAVQVRLLAAATPAPGSIDLEVADDGPGVPVEERDKVTRRFYRLDRARDTPGTGLGLALVAAIAGLHGANIQLADSDGLFATNPGESQGPGLRVRISFPRQEGVS